MIKTSYLNNKISINCSLIPLKIDLIQYKLALCVNQRQNFDVHNFESGRLKLAFMF